MHSYRLFVPQLNYIWKRIVDVLFVRPLQRRKKFSWKTLNHSNATPVYELSTVPFPMPINGVFFSKIVNFWQAGKFRLANSTFFSNKTNDLRHQKMHVVVLEHTPAVFKLETRDGMASGTKKSNSSDDSTGAISTVSQSKTFYYGLEIELLKAIAKAMRFDMVFYETFDADIERWGNVQDNETLTGLLREMHDGRADFALADLHHTQYNLGFMDLSIPYNTECLTFLTPEALSDNSWKTLILPFNREMWTGVMISLFSVGFVFYAFSNTLTFYTASSLKKLQMIPFKRKPEPWHDPLPAYDIFDTFAGCIIYTYSMLLLVSLPRLPNGWPLRVLTGWYWVYCVLVVVAYRASFTAILANPIPRLTIDTLQDLAESPIRCGAWGAQNKLFFQMAQDPYSQAIGAKLEHAPNYNEAVDKVNEGLYAYYENIYILRQLRSTRKSEKARQTLHIMQECAVHMPISIGLEKNSPLKYQVDRHVRALIEGGLTRKWLSEAIERFQSNVELPPQEATIDLKKMYAGFVALGLGYTLALFAFIAEKLYWSYVIETNPAFDKYLHGITFRRRL
ncbi:glutamate receptor U1 [Anopheles moucheti]|uniref:glutamate receptor U1 n=1 Tax=Anopheles moucheti TaxID=186751 RepID=UPI0022F01308|nr:glutamate receptor U1 [Anopheles moucheti]